MSKITFTGAVILIVAALYGNLAAQDDRFRTPVNSPSVQCEFNILDCYVTGKHHTGVDYYSSNRDILAAAPGRIVKIQPDDPSGTNADHGMGNTVIIEHRIVNTQGGYQTLYSQYSHLASFVPGLYKDEAVVKGQKIGTMGKTGGDWGVHLHFEIKGTNTLGSNPSGYWGYTPNTAVNYGYIDPLWLIGSTTRAIGNDYAYWDFSGSTNREGWELFNIEGWSVNGGKLFINPQAVDPFITSPELYIEASYMKYVYFTIANNGLDGNLSVFFKTKLENGYAPDKEFNYSIASSPLSGSAPFITYKVPIYQHPKWSGIITGIRIDPTTTGANGTGADTIGFDRIWISSN